MLKRTIKISLCLFLAILYGGSLFAITDSPSENSRIIQVAHLDASGNVLAQHDNLTIEINSVKLSPLFSIEEETPPLIERLSANEQDLEEGGFLYAQPQFALEGTAVNNISTWSITILDVDDQVIDTQETHLNISTSSATLNGNRLHLWKMGSIPSLHISKINVATPFRDL